MSKITDAVWALAEPVAERNGCRIWDVEYVKEAAEWFLRVYIDKEGGINITDCEAVSRELDPILDEADPIETAYTFEVSSAGAERALKRPSDFEEFMGSLVELRLYAPKSGSKEQLGNLAAYEDGDITIIQNGNPVKFEKNEVAAVRLRLA